MTATNNHNGLRIAHNRGYPILFGTQCSHKYAAGKRENSNYLTGKTFSQIQMD
jgi:hypothetical protein